MIRRTDTAAGPWWVVWSDARKAARITRIAHPPGRCPCARIRHDELRLGKRPDP